MVQDSLIGCEERIIVKSRNRVRCRYIAKETIIEKEAGKTQR